MEKEMIAFWGVLLGGAIAFIASLATAFYNNRKEDRRRDRENKIKKLEELHQLLTETYLRIYTKHYHAIQMLKSEASCSIIDSSLKSDEYSWNDFVSMRSRAKTLSALYAPDIKIPGNELEDFFNAFDEYGFKYRNGTATRVEFSNLNSKFKQMTHSFNTHVEEVSKLILKTVSDTKPSCFTLGLKIWYLKLKNKYAQHKPG